MIAIKFKRLAALATKTLEMITESFMAIKIIMAETIIKSLTLETITPQITGMLVLALSRPMKFIVVKFFGLAGKQKTATLLMKIASKPLIITT